MPAAALTAGTRVDIDGFVGTFVVARFVAHNRVVIRDVRTGAEREFDVAECWSRASAYNHQLAAGTGRHQVQP